MWLGAEYIRLNKLSPGNKNAHSNSKVFLNYLFIYYISSNTFEIITHKLTWNNFQVEQIVGYSKSVHFTYSFRPVSCRALNLIALVLNFPQFYWQLFFNPLSDFIQAIINFFDIIFFTLGLRCTIIVDDGIVPFNIVVQILFWILL